MVTPKRKDTSDLRGALRLAFEAASGVTDAVEAMHKTVQDVPLPVSPYKPTRTRGITGMVYRAIRGGMRLVGEAVDASIASIANIDGLADEREASYAREAVVSALNGLYGDYLVASDNELAIPMQLRAQDGRQLDQLNAEVRPRDRVLVSLHGLCMSDRQLRRADHDHAAALASQLGYTPIYLWYNTGLPVAVNGRAFAQQLERTMQSWPVPVAEITLVGFSMGGLVARNAWYRAGVDDLHWPEALRNVITLGTPHLGAPLAKLGRWAEDVIELSPYAAPIAALSKRRSAGLHDLQHGTIFDGVAPSPTPPSSVDVYTVAGVLGEQSMLGKGIDSARSLAGDGLVSVDSALARSEDGQDPRRLELPDSHRMVVEGAAHLDLLGHPAVFEKLREWISR